MTLAYHKKKKKRSLCQNFLEDSTVKLKKKNNSRTYTDMQIWHCVEPTQPVINYCTCTLLTNDNTEIDGCPVRTGSFTVSTAPVGLIEPNLLSYFIIRQSFCYRLLQCFNPVLFLSFWLCCKAETIDFSVLLIYFKAQLNIACSLSYLYVYTWNHSQKIILYTDINTKMECILLYF